jgi:beta-glucosidase
MRLNLIPRPSALAPLGLFSLLLISISFQGACGHPSTGTGGSGGSDQPGLGGGSVVGAGGSGGIPGGGGAGNEVVIGPGTDGGAGGMPAQKTSCPSASVDPLPYTAGYTPDPAIRAAATTMAQTMTDVDKQQQMSGLRIVTPPNYNVFRQEDNANGIKAFMFRDGPRGVNLNSNGDGQNDFSTAFPVAIARGAAFDDDLEFHIGQAVGDETLSSGNTIILAPTVNILRHPAWGRAQETYGEDPFLLGRLGSAFVTGVQQYVAACAKHYAGNNIENGRETANATMDEQTLREIYARHFEMIVKEGGVASIMASYNAVNGTHSTQSVHLLKDILRTDFGFQGLVLSDWWAMPNGNNAGLQVTVGQPTAIDAVNAGLDLEMPWRLNYQFLVTAVSSSGLTSAQLSAATARILEQKMRFHVDKLNAPLGLKTPSTTYNPATGSIEGNELVDPRIGVSHIDLAQKAAEESMVLLKNDNSTLPIKRSAVHNIAVIGSRSTYTVQSTQDQTNCRTNCGLDFPTFVNTGDLGSSRVFADPAKSVAPFPGIMTAAGTGITVTHGNTAADAANADFVVVIAGLTPQDEGEEYTGAGDRAIRPSNAPNFSLDAKVSAGVQDGLIRAVAALGKPMVVVLEGGSVINMPWLADVPAVVMAWYPGQVGGKALGRLLFGDVNFSGKLPLSWPASESDEPLFANASGTTQMDYYLGYRWFDNQGKTPLRSFGYGLSYTTFTYSNLQVPCSDVPADGVVNVTVDVSNNSAVAGDEVVFLFTSYPGTTARRPAKELKGYHRVSLAPKGMPGDAKQVTIPLRVKDLKYWDMPTSKWIVEKAPVKVIVAPSAAAAGGAACTGGSGVDCALTDTFTVK